MCLFLSCCPTQNLSSLCDLKIFPTRRLVMSLSCLQEWLMSVAFESLSQLSNRLITTQRKHSPLKRLLITALCASCILLMTWLVCGSEHRPVTEGSTRRSAKTSHSHHYDFIWLLRDGWRHCTVVFSGLCFSLRHLCLISSQSMNLLSFFVCFRVSWPMQVFAYWPFLCTVLTVLRQQTASDTELHYVMAP